MSDPSIKPPWARDVPMPNRLWPAPSEGSRKRTERLDDLYRPLPFAIIRETSLGRLRRWILTRPIIRWLYSPKPLIQYCPECGDPIEGQESAMSRRVGMRSYNVCIGKVSIPGSDDEKTCIHLRVSWS